MNPLNFRPDPATETEFAHLFRRWVIFATAALAVVAGLGFATGYAAGYTIH